MPNTVNITADILAQEALRGFSEITAPLNSFSTNFSPASAQKGGTVSVPIYGTIANADSFGGDYTANSSQTIGEVAVNLTTHFYKTVECSDTDASKGVDLNRLAYEAGKAVGYSVVTGAMGVLNKTRAQNGVATMTLGDPSQFGMSGVYALRTAAAKWPQKAIIAESSWYTSLLSNLPNSTTVQNDATTNGSLGKIAGFSLYETTVSPLCQGYTGAHVMAVNPSALAIASRVLTPDDGGKAYQEAGVVTEPNTNVSLGYRRFYDAKAGKGYVTFEWLGGYTAAVSGACAFIEEV